MNARFLPQITLFACALVADGAALAADSLQFLAPADAFYTFKGHLGQKRSMTGRLRSPALSSRS